MNKSAKGCIGLIPAAGLGTRLGVRDSSKEILPVNGVWHPDGSPRRLADCLLESFAVAGIEQVYWVIRDGKWDIPEHYGHGGAFGLSCAWLMMGHPWGTPFSLDQAYPFVQGRPVALGFPDIQFEPRDAFRHLLAHWATGSADVVLGAFQVDRPEKFDMLELDGANRVQAIRIKPLDSTLTYSWGIAVWGPRFTEFMHAYLRAAVEAGDLSQRPEIYVGTVFQAAMREGFRVEAEVFPQGRVLDLGTPEDLQRAAAFFA